jgi:hypothetical protein
MTHPNELYEAILNGDATLDLFTLFWMVDRPPGRGVSQITLEK